MKAFKKRIHKKGSYENTLRIKYIRNIPRFYMYSRKNKNEKYLPQTDLNTIKYPNNVILKTLKMPQRN